MNRLFLNRTHGYESRGEEIYIEANEIFSNDGQIDASPLAGREGSGSALAVPAATSPSRHKLRQANLHLICHPENGADGADGPNGHNGQKGSKGGPADIDVKPEHG